MSPLVSTPERNAAATASRARFGPLRTLRLGLARIGYEARLFFRLGDAVFFNFLFPVMMFLIFATAFSAVEFGAGPDGTGGIGAAGYYLPAMLAASVFISGTQTLSIDIATERHDGTLKRLGGSPLPVASYFIGKIGLVVISAGLQSIILLLVARFAFGVELPDEAEQWLVFGWVLLLGLGTSAVLGIALAQLPRSARSASAVVLPPVLILQFISGVYLPFAQLPEWLQTFASAFPLKWIAQGMRSVFLPEHFTAIEQHGSWELGAGAAMLGVWLVLGLAATLLTFRWIPKDK